MDRKSIIILVISFILVVTWPLLMSKLYPPPKQRPRPTNIVSQATNVVPTPPTPPTPPVTPTNIPPAIAEAELRIPPGSHEQLEVITNENARYTFTSFGGGLKSVQLLDYPAVVKCTGPKPPDNYATLNAPASTPIMAFTAPDFGEDAIFHLSRTPGGGVRAEKQMSNGLFLVKDFQLSSNYLVNTTVRWENRSNQAVQLPEQYWNVGTATLVNTNESPQMLGLGWFNGSKEISEGPGWFANRFLGCFPGTPRTLYENGQSNVVWAAVQNQFFAIALMPKAPAVRIYANEVQLPQTHPTNAVSSGKPPPRPMGIEARIKYPYRSIEPKQVFEQNFFLYAGPKEYRTLQRIGLAFNNDLDRIMGYGGFFGFFAKLLLLSMNGLHSLGMSYALAIIAITIIIKAAFWPLTQASTRSMKRMQALQPQIKALQEKFKDDPAKMNRKMMEFMKEHKVNPMGGCLPMIIQIPVFFGFYRMIQNAIELRGASFLWVCDLSRPDTIFVLPGINFPINPLPLIMGATMLWQARMTPASPGMDQMQQKMMKYMPLIFLFMLYNFSAGLTLYWTVQNLLTIVQMKLTKAKDGAAAAKAPVPTKPKKK